MLSKPALVIFLHGIGASGGQLMPLASSWRDGLHTARFAAPDAPCHSSYGNGHKWFSVDGHELQPERIHAIRRAFDDLVHDVVQREGFAQDLDRIAFVGISQGAIMGLDAVASGRWPIGALVSFAGLLPPLSISAASQRTPILLVHGLDDKTIPSAASTLAASQLRAAGFIVELDMQGNVGHTVSADCGRNALRFLQEKLN